jgi:N-acetylglucosamine kinase-like BadF-type ATPase
MTRGLWLGVDGGGTKTGFVLLDTAGRIVSRHRESGAYHLQIGMDGLRSVLERGLSQLFSQAGVDATAIEHAFFGLPAHGEDSALQPQLDVLPASLLGHGRYRCGNDVLCTWAGALAGQDGIGLVAGTGAIGYGERHGVGARASGWGELFGDEGSAYWVAIRGFNAFSRMCDGRLPQGPLHALVIETFGLQSALDLCGRLMGPPVERDRIASYSSLVSRAAAAGDLVARGIFEAAADELAQVAAALRRQLGWPNDETIPVSYSGGLFDAGDILIAPLRASLAARCREFDLRTPVLSPGVGAALYAARDRGQPLAPAAIERLREFELAQAVS